MTVKSLPINLESLIELSARLNETHDIKFILNAALLTLMGKLTISNGCVFLLNNEVSIFDLIVSKGRFEIHQGYHFSIDKFTELSENSKEYRELYKQGLKYLVPVFYTNKLVAVFCLGKRIIDETVGDTELQYSNLIASITANALEVAKEHNRLSQTKNQLEIRNLTLKTLFEVTHDFSTLLSYEQILKLLSYHLMGQLMVNKFAVYGIGEDEQIREILDRCDKKIPHEIIKLFLDLKKPVTREEISEIKKISIFNDTDLEIISPMMVQGKIKGLLLVGKRMNGAKFNEDNISFIKSLGNVAISSIENERLFKEELEKKKLENELELALEIQKGFLPKEFPILNDFQMYGLSVPSRHVAGDYFDFIQMSEDRLMVIIADVSGKGVAASLIMANIQAALKVLSNMNLSLNEIIRQLNIIVFENTDSDKFVTFFLGILNLKNKNFEYINAGHNPPLVFSKSGIKRLSKGGLPLGVFLDEYEYQSGSYHLESNDLMLFYTDGITEAQDIDHSEFGEDRLIKSILKNSKKSPKQIVENIVAELKEYSRGFYQYDDITISAVKIK